MPNAARTIVHNIAVYGILALLLAAATIYRFQISPFYDYAQRLLFGRATVATRVAEFRSSFDLRLKPALEAAGIFGIPRRVTLVFFKDTKRLELYSGDEHGQKLVKVYEAKAASGSMGPKLREGDRQVPEGIYAVEALNPNSAFHVSLRLNYPNAWDREMAAREGRSDLGGDIMIHGSSVSIGCIAVGNDAIEEIFVLAAMSGPSNWKVILAPSDFRKQKKERSLAASSPAWLPNLYEQIEKELRTLGG